MRDGNIGYTWAQTPREADLCGDTMGRFVPVGLVDSRRNHPVLPDSIPLRHVTLALSTFQDGDDSCTRGAATMCHAVPLVTM